jgi:hypothetical protein
MTVEEAREEVIKWARLDTPWGYRKFLTALDDYRDAVAAHAREEGARDSKPEGIWTIAIDILPDDRHAFSRDDLDGPLLDLQRALGERSFVCAFRIIYPTSAAGEGREEQP